MSVLELPALLGRLLVVRGVPFPGLGFVPGLFGEVGSAAGALAWLVVDWSGSAAGMQFGD